MMTNDLFPDSGEAGFKTVWSATNTQVEQTLTLFFLREKKLNKFTATCVPGSAVICNGECFMLRSHCVFQKWRRTPKRRRKIWIVELRIVRYL